MYRFAVAALFVGSLCGQTPVQSNKPSPQDLLKEAVALHQQGKLDEAIHDYYLFLDRFPSSNGVRSNLGAALVGVGKYKEAIEQYRLALSEKPDPDVRLNLALAYYKSAQYSDAVRELTAVHKERPDNAKATMLLADCKLRQGENQQVIELLSPLRTSNPDDLGIAYLLGTALVRDNQISQGQLVIGPILNRGDSAEARLLMGATRFAAHEFAPAVADFAKAVELNPDLPLAWSYYGLALFSMGEMSKSKTAFLKALEEDPNDFDANLHVGTMFRLDQEFGQALPYLQRAAAVRPSDVATEYQLALLKLAENKTEQAREQLESVVKAAPSFTEAHVSLATVYYREKRKDDGDRERAIVQKLNADRQAQTPGAALSNQQSKESGDKGK
jgi:tetratricopeptide (TPR) repeat protein